MLGCRGRRLDNVSTDRKINQEVPIAKHATGVQSSLCYFEAAAMSGDTDTTRDALT